MKKIVVILMVAAVLLAAIAAYVSIKKPFDHGVVTIQADKEGYNIGEEITFKLVSLNRNADFRASGSFADCGIYIGKVPAGTSIHDLNANHSAIQQNPLWNERPPQVTFLNFNGNSEPLDLSWDGTYSWYNETSGEREACLATSGDYLIVPKLWVTAGDSPEVRFDHGSMFHLNSLDVDTELSFNTTSEALTLDLSISSGMSRATNGQLNSTLHFPDKKAVPLGSNDSDYIESYRYLNDSLSFDNGSWSGTITVTPRPDSLFARFEAIIITDAGNFIFGIWGQVSSDYAIEHINYP